MTAELAKLNFIQRPTCVHTVFPLAGTNRYRLRWPRQSFPNMTVGHKHIRFAQLHSSH